VQPKFRNRVSPDSRNAASEAGRFEPHEAALVEYRGQPNAKRFPPPPHPLTKSVRQPHRCAVKASLSGRVSYRVDSVSNLRFGARIHRISNFVQISAYAENSILNEISKPIPFFFGISSNVETAAFDEISVKLLVSQPRAAPLGKSQNRRAPFFPSPTRGNSRKAFSGNFPLPGRLERRIW